ncbi:MAG: ATP synthase F1 subunit delta [Thermoanaerobaculia bacterium]|nr:ATP synthase F1 subunit delta [Thermoanaerobaculia bacterium]
MIGAVDERDLAIGRVYAQSLLELAEERGEADALGDELASLVEVLDDTPELEGFFTDPLVESEERAKAIETVFRGRLSHLLVDGLQVINRKGRLALVRAVAEAYRRALEELRGQVDVEVTTAVPLSEAQRAGLMAAAARFSGRTPRLAERVDETLLGGMVLAIGDRKFDTSLAKELSRLEDLLVERASREIHGGRRFTAEAD